MRVPILKEPGLIPDTDDINKISITTKCGGGGGGSGGGGGGGGGVPKGEEVHNLWSLFSTERPTEVYAE